MEKIKSALKGLKFQDSKVGPSVEHGSVVRIFEPDSSKLQSSSGVSSNVTSELKVKFHSNFCLKVYSSNFKSSAEEIL